MDFLTIEGSRVPSARNFVNIVCRPHLFWVNSAPSFASDYLYYNRKSVDCFNQVKTAWKLALRIPHSEFESLTYISDFKYARV